MPVKVSSCLQIISRWGWNFKCFPGTSYLENSGQPLPGTASVWFVYADIPALGVNEEIFMLVTIHFPSTKASALILLKRSFGICLLLNSSVHLWKTEWNKTNRSQNQVSTLNLMLGVDHRWGCVCLSCDLLLLFPTSQLRAQFSVPGALLGLETCPSPTGNKCVHSHATQIVFHPLSDIIRLIWTSPWDNSLEFQIIREVALI